jgi:hypothetical protein
MRNYGFIGILLLGFVAGVFFVYSCDWGGSAQAVEVKTGYYSLGIESFHYFDLEDNLVQAPINLPHNATIYSVTACFTDNHYGSISVGLWRTSLDGNMVNLKYISSETVTGTGTVTETFPDGIVIDNLNNSYSWRWTVPVGPTWEELHLDSVVIEYEYET